LKKRPQHKILKSTEKLKNNREFKKLEYLICFVQVLIQLWLAVYFTIMAADAGSHEDVRIIIFISYYTVGTRITDVYIVELVFIVLIIKLKGAFDSK
jgi:hypothetical protein